MSSLYYDNLRPDDVMAEMKIRIHRSGAMSVSGDIHDEKYALAMIDAARDSIINHHKRNKSLTKGIMLPAHDNPLS